ncbi:unnamed protein product [Lactuca saligna]|uniref:Uncharacterized protein n=1 Tax=Lactuca saligna TaxID=75948 RepID=A0AA36ENV2_LACSI|nr:unnamed protein product [Lactuca saligna]
MVESILERFTKEHVANASTMTKEISDSADVCKSLTKKVEKLTADTIEFMEDYKNTYNSNIVTTNKAIQNDLAMENKIMDALAIKEEKCKVLETQLHYTEKQVDDLQSEKAVTRSCISNVTGLLSNIIETREPMNSITGEKCGSKVQSNEPPKAPVNPLVIKKETKCKEKLFNDEPIIDDEGDKDPDEAKLKRHKAREAELDEHACIVREAEEKEKAKKEAQVTLKIRMMLFPKWTLKRIQNEVVDLPGQCWLDPVASFDVQNSQDSQLDLPLALKAFRYRAFVKFVDALLTDSKAGQMLFAFYLKHMKPQHENWSIHKIIAVKVTRLIETESFSNEKFKVGRGSSCQAYEFTLADLPCLNPHDWIVLYNMLLRAKEKYRPLMILLQLMIKSYI